NRPRAVRPKTNPAGKAKPGSPAPSGAKTSRAATVFATLGRQGCPIETWPAAGTPEREANIEPRVRRINSTSAIPNEPSDTARCRRVCRYFLPLYQSALVAVNPFHFSGRSSSAKIAVTGQTGTQA